MEVDTVSWSSEAQRCMEPEADKFSHMKGFAKAAREFHATHSDTSISMMSRHLGLIVSTCDLSIFSPGRAEVCAFFTALWRVMSDPRGPHWAGVAALARAACEPNARYALTHTYKFLPALAHLLTDSISLEKKMRLLSLLQDVTYGIKISWQEPYLPSLLKQLTDWVSCDTSTSTLGRASLSVLVNLCQGNIPSICTLQHTVDTKQFVTRLINMKNDGYGGVEVCRLLLCLSVGGRGLMSSHRHVHSYLACVTCTLSRAVCDRDSTQLLHTYMFLNDLCNDPVLKTQVVSYQHFTAPLSEVIKEALDLCSIASADSSKPELEPECLEHVLNCLTVLTKLELFSLRGLHGAMLELTVKGSRICLAPSLQLTCSILSQYREEGRLPQELMLPLAEALPSLLVPPALEAGKAGIPWLNMVGELCDFNDLQERLLHNLTAALFEETVFSVLNDLQQGGSMCVEDTQHAALVGCRVALSLAPHSKEWDAALARLLAHHQVCKLLSACLSGPSPRRRSVLQLVKHPHFPPDKINQVFSQPDLPPPTTEFNTSGAAANVTETLVGLGAGEDWGGVPVGREQTIDSLVERLTRALDKQQIGDVATSSIMDLYGHKISCLEQRLHAHMDALKAASDHAASVQHSLAMLHTTNNAQQELLYTSQIQSERQKEQMERMSSQLEDAEKSVRGFRTKLAAERLDKDNQINALKNAQRTHITTLESEIKSRDKELVEREKTIEKLQAEVKTLNSKLQQQSTKNNDLAGVLVKFEERVKTRDRKLEEAATTEAALRKELDHKELAVKQLEKTVLERENRLYQTTNQLEEMKRVQDMVAKLMSSGKAGS